MTVGSSALPSRPLRTADFPRITWCTPSRALMSPRSVLMSMACARSSVPCSSSITTGSSVRASVVLAPS